MAVTIPGPDAHFHGVHFYDDAPEWCRTVARFIIDGLRRHEATVAIVTPLHHALIVEHLLTAEVSERDLLNTQSPQLLDAGDTLRLFMRDDGPDRELFHLHVGGLVRAATEARSPARIRAYGEMVDLLSQQGRHEDAAQLETLWNELASTVEMSLLCGYAMCSFPKGIPPTEALVQHTHMLSPNGDFMPVLVPTA